MSLRAARQALLDDPALGGIDFCRSYSAAADAELSRLLTDAAGGDLQGLALLAVGGYGRGELCPHSDLDLVLVHKQRRDVASVADSVWYPVWDEGVHLDYSVRTSADVLSMATADLRVQLGLLDGRLVAGDAEVGEPVLARARELWRSRAAQWLPVLANQVVVRHRAHGDVAFLLEPDLKEAHGGLRDLAGLHAAVTASPSLSRDDDLLSLEPAHRVLLRVRVELHRRSPRAVETLLLQEQDAVASALGYADADLLMFDVAKAGRSISWVGDDLWSRSALWQVTKKRRRWLTTTDTEPQEQRRFEVEPGVSVSEGSGGHPNGEVVLSSSSYASEPAIALRMAVVAAKRDIPLEEASMLTLSATDVAIEQPWPDSVRKTFIDLLSAGHPTIRVVEALDHYGLFARYLPEWEAVRNKPQRNAYHRFTVDRHLLEAVVEASKLRDGLSRPDLLVVGALLHDIGKGFPGDHTEVGIAKVTDIATRMGFSDDDVRILVDMVRFHLLLPDTATRRDLDDPATIEKVARAAGDLLTLDLLARLTEADSLATGPAAWGHWKAGLVAELVRRTASSLEGNRLPPKQTLEFTEQQVELMARVRSNKPHPSPVVVAQGPGVTVFANDRPGLLASVTGVLCLHALDLRSADIAESDGVAVEAFVCEPTHGRWPDWEKVRSDLEMVLAGELALGDLLAKRDETYARPRTSTGPLERFVTSDNSASETATVVEVRAPDQIALLHRITSVLFDYDLDVAAARISTVGDQVVDAFYVTDRPTGQKIVDSSRLKKLESALLQAINT